MKIYALVSSSEPEKYKYIGYTTKRLNTRLSEHMCDSKNLRTIRDKWIQKNIKIGNKILILELDEAETISELKNKEKQYIRFFRAIGARLKNGTDGGDGATNHKCTEALKKWNTETKSKIIYVFNYKTGEFINEFKGTMTLCRALNLNRSAVAYSLSGEEISHKGMWFSRTKIFNPRGCIKNVWNKGIKTKGMQKFKTTPVRVYKNGITKIFETVNDAADFFQIRRESICRIIKTTKRHKGYSVTNEKLFIPGTEYVDLNRES